MLTAILLILTLFFMFITFRTIKVGKFRRNIIDLISKASNSDIEKVVSKIKPDTTEKESDLVSREAKDSWPWRYEEFKRVAFERMTWTFWKPLDRFYDPDIWNKDITKEEFYNKKYI